MMEKIEYLSSHDFTQWACEQVRDGYGFVPLVGSGISTKSGILMGVEFTDYLTWTVYRCVAWPGKDQDGHRLDLRSDGWPRQPRPAEMRHAKKWVWRLFEEACRHCGLEPSQAKEFECCVKSVALVNGSAGGVPFEAALRRPLVPAALKCAETVVDDQPIKTFFRTLQHDEYLKTFRGDPETSPTSRRYIEESAVRALHDWRSTLEFLSRLRLHNDEHLCLEDAPSQAVVDSFNLHITRGRRPNLAHGMLCHLAARARMRTILTTNFDTLIEDAFAQIGESCAVFPVSLNGDLPPPDSVHAQNCIVKLHGGVAETRANHSLDEPPSDEDKRRFFHYIRGRYPDESKSESGFLPSNLLICGYSGSDMRCVHMIKYVLDSDPEAQVFWICHSHRDVERLYTLFAADGYEIAANLRVLHEQSASGKLKARVIATVSPRTDLLLYEFYQRLTLTLPRGGFNFPLSHNVPPEKSFAS
ncbi:MAG: hypothetical protein JWL90_3979, partial [Chthoniobacteraceae bacterium]|nr:hypothetical protein [Chthoniobacteraceae bacterium]